MRLPAVLLTLVASVAAGAPDVLADTGDRPGRCFALAAPAGHGFLGLAGPAGYEASQPQRAAAAFYLKPTTLGTFMLHDRRGLVLAAGPSGLTGLSEPGPAAEWVRGRRGAVRPRAAVAPAFTLVPRRACRPYPEAEVGARGGAPRRRHADGSVFGFADLHLHITAELRAGGRVINGKSFARYGITRALGGDAAVHGPDGRADLIGNLLRTGTPDATHDTFGWPSFSGWPVHDTYTHHQTYYVWLERMWRAGLRLAVAETVEDEPLCRLAPTRLHSCDEMEAVALQVARLRELERYVDAQSGGPGRGWFRLVYDSREGRRVMERGKLAVVIGMETSSPLCSKLGAEAPSCTPADVTRGVAELHRLGVRSMFLAHWIDNAFAGPALQPGGNGTLIGFMQQQATGGPFTTVACPGGDEAGGRCNARGLTPLGLHLLRRMKASGMLIEADHLSQRTKEGVLAFAAANRYPVVSGHTDTGGEWTPAQLRLLYALGSQASATPEEAPALAAKILRLQRLAQRGRPTVALGTDTGGLASLPGPRAGGALSYPFRSYDGRLRFDRQRTGERSFDLGTDGVAHYGLFADLLADMRRQPGGERAMDALFRSAEGYLRMWERAEASNTLGR